ncbi:hypothetical protein [Pseudooceanicola sp. HF7]|uniref:hypothetical protein n=1 Tax=Pseudooceanicola sp. HF7 TaxID=2721560 RepID=UPI001C37DAAC|nr:hypothetical protein [Pseudooceanicola sp. HF7]
MPHAHKAMVTAAKVMASTAARVVRDSDLRSAAQAEFRKRRGGEAYRSPMPDDKTPPKNSRSS